jgi:hypothetical protein
VGEAHVKQNQGSWVGILVCVCQLSLSHSLIGKRGSSGISLVCSAVQN